jgi:hypothetical protein
MTPVEIADSAVPALKACLERVPPKQSHPQWMLFQVSSLIYRMEGTCDRPQYYALPGFDHRTPPAAYLAWGADMRLCVSIHNIRTIAPCYKELLALLIIPTWLLHWFPRFEPALVPRSLAWNLPLSARYLRYVAAPLLVPAQGSSLDGCMTGLVTLTSTHMYCYLLDIHTCDGECEHS